MPAPAPKGKSALPSELMLIGLLGGAGYVLYLAFKPKTAQAATNPPAPAPTPSGPSIVPTVLPASYTPTPSVVLPDDFEADDYSQPTPVPMGNQGIPYDPGVDMQVPSTPSWEQDPDDREYY